MIQFFTSLQKLVSVIVASQMTLASVIILLRLTIINDAYYLSQNALFWPDAESFCNIHCGSNLASIHSDEQYTEIKNLILNDDITSLTNAAGNGYWIGLNKSTVPTIYQWTDGSTFDFASDLSGGVNPWLPNEPDSSYPYVQLQKDSVIPSNNLRWKAQGTTEKAPAICNECDWTKLSKYIYIGEQRETWINAEQFCNDNFGTNLASIHNQMEQEEAAYVQNTF